MPARRKQKKPDNQVDPRVFPAGSSVVAYLRASTGDNQDMSVGRQEAIVRDWAAQNGVTISRIFCDDDRSGRKIAGRDEFLRMIDYFNHDPADAGIVMWEYSRFFRDYDKAQRFLSIIREQGYQVVSISQPLPQGPVGRAVESIYLAAAEEESLRLSARITSGNDNVITNYHCWTTNQPPYGYMFEQVQLGYRRSGAPHYGRRLVPDPERAPLVQKMFAMRLEGRTQKEIWYATGKPFTSVQTTSYLLRNPIYKGLFVGRRVTVENFCEPLIDEATWQAVQDMMDDHLERFGPRRARSRFLLSGLLVCSICGRNLAGRHQPHKCPDGHRIYTDLYFCPSATNNPEDKCGALMLNAKRLDAQVVGRVLELLDKPALLKELQAQYAEAAARGDVERQAELATAKRKLSEVHRQQNEIMTVIRSGSNKRTPAVIMSELADLEEREQEAGKRIAEIESRAPAPLVVPDLDALRETIRAAVKDADQRKLQLLLREIIVEIRVKKEGKAFVGEMDYALGAEGTIPL